MNLDHLYSLRKSFTIIGLTGRTGSGCSRISEILGSEFCELEKSGLRLESDFTDKVFYRKYQICKQYLSYKDNWAKFESIRYVNVLMFFIFYKIGGDIEKTKKLFLEYFKENKKENNEIIVNELMPEIIKINKKHITLIKKIKVISDLTKVKETDELENINSLFFGDEFKDLSSEMFIILEKFGYIRTRKLLHWTSCNIRSSGDPIDDTTTDINNIYTIAKVINRLIKARKHYNDSKGTPTKIVIDSLRNSLEIMFFKERYSAFYMVAVKDAIGNTKDRLMNRIKEKEKTDEEAKIIIEEIIKLDETEYKTSDFSKGTFSSPDLENCIQKSDYHILNLKINSIRKDDNKNCFLTREEQLMKLIALINQPGIITPSSAERGMQIANTAKLNSGCISRKVGAVVTDAEYYVLATGWNDVAKGHTPCNLRSVTDYLLTPEKLSSNQHYSKFEKGEANDSSSFKYKNDTPGNFKDALIDYFKDPFDAKNDELRGKNCSFCFKTVHNHYEGEANQVHTRSLHAEENAMLQLTKIGGIGARGGILFTTASPCELCSKKAYQLGIKKIIFIDPYPGIAVDQILKGGHLDSQPILVPFSGALGNAYHKLYEPFLAYKDEITMTLEIKPKKKKNNEIATILKIIGDETINNYMKDDEIDEVKVKEIFLAGIKSIKST